MRRLLTVLAAAALAAGCSKSDPAPAQEEAPEIALAEEEEAVEPEAVPEEEDTPFVLTPKLLDRYVAYEKDFVELLDKVISEMATEAEKLDEDGETGTMEGLGFALAQAKRIEKMEASQKALLEKHDLSEDEADEIDRIVGDVATLRMLWKQSDGEKNLAEMESQLKAQLADVPIEARAEAEAQVGELLKSMTEMRDLVEARRTHGDAAVELVLTREAELVELREKMMKAALER